MTTATTATPSELVAATVEPESPVSTDVAAAVEDASVKTPVTPKSPGGFRNIRLPLRRAFSTKHSSRSSPTLSPSATPAADEPARADDPIADAKSTQSDSKAKTKVKTGPLDRILKLGAKKGGKAPKDGAPKSAVFPPADWASPGTTNGDAAPAPIALDPLPSTPPSADNVLQSVAEVAEEEVITTETNGDADPEPANLARKIHSLLLSVPPFLTSLNKVEDGSSSAPTLGIPDSRLISLLSSPSIMNGSIKRGRQSVWAMLDALRTKTLADNLSASAEATSFDEDGADGEAGVYTALGDDFLEKLLMDDGSVMFYGPLVPDEASSVDLAASELIVVDEEGLPVGPPPRAPASSSPAVPVVDAQRLWFPGIWPWNRKKPIPKPPPKVLLERRVWVPSTEKLSVQVMWWGYRLWLPPPVMSMLNDKNIEAAKLGAMITTALSWILNNVPETVLPPTLRPALALLKSLVPYLGYIGGFVAWSWSAIKGFDVGNGVTLTATWLLPIALIPGTWESKDVPQPAPPEPEPQPEPPVPAPSDPTPVPPTDPAPPSTDPTSPPSTDPSVPPPSDPPATPPTTGCPGDPPATPPPADPAPAPSQPSEGTPQTTAAPA